MKPKANKPIPLITFVLGLSALYAFTINIWGFINIPETHLKGYINIFLQWLVVSAVSTGIITVISLNKYIFTLFSPFLCMISSTIAYFGHTLGVGLTATTIEIAIENNLEMWSSVVDFQLLKFIILSLIISVFFIWLRWCKVKTRFKWEKIPLLFFALFMFLPSLFPRIQGAVNNRMPYAIYSSVKEYFVNKKDIHEERYAFNNVTVKRTETSPDIVLVLGETLRGDHLQLNGYQRETMPNLSKEKNIVSFLRMYSTGTHTSESLPFLMTRADSIQPELGYIEESFISLFKKAGYSTAWIANQDISPSYTFFAHEADTLIHVNSNRSLYSYSPWMDSDIIPHFKEWQTNLTDQLKLTIIHSIGSHWWYKSHYQDEEALFLPDMDSKELAVLKPEQIINSYDNTIIATDKFILNLIDLLREKNVILIFVSDHGENLGENGVWLHGKETEELHNVAAFIWWSDTYFINYESKINSLKNNVDKDLSSDNLFYTILDCADIETSILDKTKSWINVTEN